MVVAVLSFGSGVELPAENDQCKENNHKGNEFVPCHVYLVTNLVLKRKEISLVVAIANKS